ncbi:uncharacterized protein LOC117174781 [Belonocnema kinseyi]|uniref:uncharacterized protein LOC117174781 n=1 Tax=Belonocnema kinseyi TaxID=2817044 RepID=UPI00143DEA78|nr:uncharacterized protein LOC117174781 [Belonocnema kinseyi]XP_033220038.1 uncharacterized protein LOC117174781 [Belonocnema kinseyi]XP_033220039.1 uncharacterized protein LOC117174781 [Belonocnema kinseyi]
MESENNDQCRDTRKRSQSTKCTVDPSHVPCKKRLYESRNESWSEDSSNFSENESEEFPKEDPTLLKSLGRNQTKRNENLATAKDFCTRRSHVIESNSFEEEPLLEFSSMRDKSISFISAKILSYNFAGSLF